MRSLFFSILLMSGLAAHFATADTLELANGSLLEGEFAGFTNGIVMFKTDAGIKAFPKEEVVGIFMSAGVETREREHQAVAAPQSAPAAPAMVTVPSGTRLVIRMADSIDSNRHKAGHRFRGQLEGAIVIDGMTVIPRGSILHGRVTQASSGGRAVGSSSMGIEFTDVMIDDQLFEIATTGLQAQTDNEAKKTAGRTARTAAIGGLIGGSSGAKTGAKVGVGASILTSGSSINVPAGTMLETTLRVPLTVPAA